MNGKASTATCGSHTERNDILDFPKDDKERQEATDPFFPLRTNPFLDVEKAVQFYRNSCGKFQLQVNHSFVKYLRSGSVIMEFDNGYLGENGIIPIMSTLKNFRILKVLLPKCMLEDNDIKLICDTFCNHPTLEALDLRGNKISASGAKNILRLLLKNKRITEVLLDPETPKFANIVNQASQNGSAELRSCSCLCCDHPVVYCLADEVEMRFLKNLLNNFQLTMDRISKVQVEVLFRLVLFCCEVRNGILSLCSEKCLDKLSRQLYECLGFVTRACDFNLAYDLSDTHPLFRQCLPEIITEVNCRPLTERDYRGEDSDSSDNIENYFDVSLEEKEGLHEECTVCGQKGKCSRNGFVMLLEQLVKELDRNVEISSSSLLRICHVMISQVNVRPCSRKCIRQLIRFGLTGFYGVIRAFPQTHQVHLLSTSGVSTQFLSASSFSVVNFSDVVVDRLDEEEITCALTVASAMEDIDSVPIDPYLIFAIGRHVRHQPPTTIGMELQGACEAVHLVGCLPQSEAPFHRRAGDRPPRRFYANWEDWHRLGDVQHYLHCAFARRRVSVFAVDGPHGNMFDNIRGAMWAFRHQKRSVVVAMKFSSSWLVEKSGMISETSSAAGGFYTTVKVVGQTTINNSLFLILQGNFGPNAGQKGFFYVPKSVFNRHYVHNAYIFVDLPGSAERSSPSKLYATKLIQPSSLAAVSAAEKYGDVFSLLQIASRFYPFYKKDMGVLGRLLEKPLPQVAHLTGKTELLSPWHGKWQNFFRLLVTFSPSISQLAHYFNEICSPDARNVLYEVFASDNSPCLPAELHTRILQLNGKRRRSVDVTSLNWHTVKPERILGGSTLDLKVLSKKKKKKVEKRGRPIPVQEVKENFGSSKTGTHVAEYLEAVWKTERERLDKMAQKMTTPQYAIESIFPYACSSNIGNLLFSRTGEDPSSSTPKTGDDFSDDSLKVSLIGYRWNLIHLMADDQGNLSHLVVGVIQQKACLYDLAMQKVVVPLAEMFSMELFSNFPFTSGFDACFHHPLDRRYVYFFSNNSWIEWDALKYRCMRGPFEVSSHPLFKSLPVQFHQRLQAVIPVVGTPYVAFCSQKSYILFNMEKKLPESGPQLMLQSKPSQKMESCPPSSPFSLSKVLDVISSLWSTCQGEIITCFFPLEPHKSGNVVVVFANGELLEANFSPHASNLKMSLPTSSLQGLPMVFRQVTMEAIPYLCDLIEKACLMASEGVRLTELNRFDLTFYQKRLLEKVRITCSNFKRTSTADHFPYSLHSIMPMKKRSVLLSDEVHFLGSTPASEDRKDSTASTYVEYDFGWSQSIGFSAVILFMDLSHLNPQVLEISPPSIAVESSMDQVTYTMHSTFRASCFVSHSKWSESHVGRFWRLRFLNPLPSEVGIVRVFWYRGKYSTAHSPLPILESFVPLPGSATIAVGAEVVMRQPEDLFWGNPLGGPVFATSTEKGWYEKHAVLPILPMGDTCLFFCGTTFAEVDMLSNEVVCNRSLSFCTHPCFSRLPSPFNRGFDAIFYPNENDPSIVLILRDGYELKWNLSTGTAASSVERCATQSFKGIDIDMARIYDVLNVWGKPGEVDVVFIIDEDYHAGVIRWNVQKRLAVDLPTPIRDVPDFFHSEFHGKRLLCLFSTPRNRHSVFVFAESLVANSRLIPHAVEATASSFFFRLGWALPNWMKRQEECIIHIDFMAHLPLILGVVFVASSPGNPYSPWRIEYSDDGDGWKSVGVHHFQENPFSTTTWLPRQVENQAHRFWRFVLPLNHDDAAFPVTGVNPVTNTHLALKSISFLALPVFPFTQPSIAPIYISSSATNDVVDLFKGDRNISFSAHHSSSTVDPSAHCHKSLILPVHHITLDYHGAPVHLSSFSCDTRSQSSSDQWYVYCSDDGNAWHRAAVGNTRNGHIQMTWISGRSFRFWRFEYQADGPRELFHFTLYGYKGPCIRLNRRSFPLPASVCPSLLSLLYTSNADDILVERQDCLRFDVYSDATIFLDTKADRASIVGVKLLCSFSSLEKIEFIVEYSNDVVWWYERTRFFFIGDSKESSVFWNSVGSHRFWRLRVLSSSPLDSGYVLLQKVLFFVAPTQLYHIHLSHMTSRASPLESRPEEVYFTSPKPISFVRVETELPPNCVYAVEKLGLDGISWEMVKQIENPDLYFRRKTEEGWGSVMPSTSWRVRFLDFLNPEIEPSEPTFPRLQQPVKWFAFTNRRLTRVRCEDLPDLEITFQRFEVLNSLDALHNNSDFPILQMADSPPSVSSIPMKDVQEEGENPEDIRRTRRKEDDHRKSPRSTKQEAKREELKKNRDKANSKPGEAFQGGKEKREADAWTRSEVKTEDPSILYSFKFPTSLHQAYIYATAPQEVESPPLGGHNVVKVLNCSGKAQNALNDESGSEERPGTDEDKREEAGKVVMGPNPPTAVVVEISDNGADFMVLARSNLGLESTMLAWCGEESSHHWRIRFENTLNGKRLLVFTIKWFSFQGVASKCTPLDPFLVSNCIYCGQLMEAFNCEEELRSNCRAGLDQVKSCASKLREEFDMDTIGKVASSIVGRRKTYQHFWAKISKSAVRNAPAPEGLFFGPSSTLAKDLNYYLYRTSQKFRDSGFDTLTQIVQSPLVFKEWKVNKKESPWFYPSFEVTGILLNEVFHFSAVSASFIILWSLSAPVQRNIGLLTDSGISCVGVHVASPLIVMSIENDSWSPEDHFPFVPFLNHGGYANKRMSIIFSLNELYFTEKYTIRSPLKGVPLSNQPFRISPGVNFFRNGSVSSCLSPIFGLLNQIYEDAFLQAYTTPIILSVPSLRYSGGKISFTLPARKVNFGIEGLEIGSLEFEVTMHMLHQAVTLPMEGEELANPPDPLYGECEYQITFLSHGATFQIQTSCGVDRIPLALTGSFDGHGFPVIQLQGISTSCNVPLIGIKGCHAGAVKFSCVVSCGEEPQSFSIPRIVVTGNLVLSSRCTVMCHYTLAQNTFLNAVEKLHLDLWEETFDDLLAISQWLKNASTELPVGGRERVLFMQKENSATHILPCLIYASLELNLSVYKLFGTGEITLSSEHTGSAEFTVDGRGFRIVSTLKAFECGVVKLRNPVRKNEEMPRGVLIEISAFFVDGVRPELSVEVYGVSSFFFPNAQTKVHISRQGSICLCWTPYFLLSSEENVTELACNNAVVTVRNSTLMNKIVHYLKTSPMIVALLANGLPFCFSNEKLSVTPFNAADKRLSLALSGVLFGNFFEVMSCAFNPTEESLSYDVLCEILALRAIEACQEMIWVSYGSVVGCLQQCDSQVITGMQGKDMNENPKRNTFTSRWSLRKHESSRE